MACETLTHFAKKAKTLYLHTRLGFPGQTQFIGQDSSCDRSAVISTPSHQHHSQPGHFPLGPEDELGAGRRHLLNTIHAKRFKMLSTSSCMHATTRKRKKIQCNFDSDWNIKLHCIKELSDSPWTCLHLYAQRQCGNSNETRCVSPCTSHLRCWYELSQTSWSTCNNGDDR